MHRTLGNVSISNSNKDDLSLSNDNIPDPVCTKVNKTTNFRVASINARLVTNKLQDIANLFNYANINIACVSESWETLKNEGAIEEMQELQNLTWIGKRRDCAKGGGAAVIINNSFGTASEIKEIDTGDLEIVWIIITPFAKPHLKLIVGSFYSSSGANHKPDKGVIQDHVISTFDYCLTKYRNCWFILSGDANADDFSNILSLDQHFQQHVDQPTRGDKILDITISNLPSTSCEIYPPSVQILMQTVYLRTTKYPSQLTTFHHQIQNGRRLQDGKLLRRL